MLGLWLIIIVYYFVDNDTLLSPVGKISKYPVVDNFGDNRSVDNNTSAYSLHFVELLKKTWVGAYKGKGA